MKYFIERKADNMWWYPENDYTRPRFISTFNGSRIRMPGWEHKDLWTNDPLKANAFNNREEAQRFIDGYIVRVPDGTVEVTEHEFPNP